MEKFLLDKLSEEKYGTTEPISFYSFIEIAINKVTTPSKELLELREGYRVSSEEDKELLEDWDVCIDEGWE